jgi:hypothetical protein
LNYRITRTNPDLRSTLVMIPSIAARTHKSAASRAMSASQLKQPKCEMTGWAQ